MTLLKDLVNTAPSNEALLRVFADGQISLNAAAKQLLGLTSSSKVVFRVSAEPGPEGTKRLYIGERGYNAYKLTPRGNGYRIHATKLSRSIADSLQGYGTYRIEAENSVKDFNGDVFYSIFYRKY